MGVIEKRAVDSDVEDSLSHEFRSAKHHLLSSGDLKDEEKNILRKVSLQVHHADTMYAGNAFRYLSVGLSASRCIREALRHTPESYTVGSVLDFPCGYGRVLRFLRVMFPDSDITAVDIDRTALDFCGSTFSVNTVLSKTDLGELALPQKFDFIWCGSLITHIDEQATGKLLQFLYDHLSEQGVCVFTTHGQRAIDRILSKHATYGLTEDGQQRLIQAFQSKGYGYADCQGQVDYGISAVSYQRMLELAGGVGEWNKTFFLEHGWDNHQDVYAFSVHRPERRVEAGKLYSPSCMGYG